jgi:hypothetical protein
VCINLSCIVLHCIVLCCVIVRPRTAVGAVCHQQALLLSCHQTRENPLPGSKSTKERMGKGIACAHIHSVSQSYNLHSNRSLSISYIFLSVSGVLDNFQPSNHISLFVVSLSPFFFSLHYLLVSFLTLACLSFRPDTAKINSARSEGMTPRNSLTSNATSRVFNPHVSAAQARKPASPVSSVNVAAVSLLHTHARDVDLWNYHYTVFFSLAEFIFRISQNRLNTNDFLLQANDPRATITTPRSSAPMSSRTSMPQAPVSARGQPAAPSRTSMPAKSTSTRAEPETPRTARAGASRPVKLLVSTRSEPETPRSLTARRGLTTRASTESVESVSKRSPMQSRPSQDQEDFDRQEAAQPEVSTIKTPQSFSKPLQRFV